MCPAKQVRWEQRLKKARAPVSAAVGNIIALHGKEAHLIYNAKENPEGNTTSSWSTPTYSPLQGTEILCIGTSGSKVGMRILISMIFT